MERALQAIAEPRRRAILKLLAERERAAGEVAARFPDISRPAISQHLKLLHAAGLVDERPHGTRRLFRASASGIRTLRAQLDRFWDAQLARLQAPRKKRRRA